MDDDKASDAIDETFLEFPATWFGGKRTVASLVWDRFGTVTNFIEPFCGSAAMLLGRPMPFDGVETINDADAFVANFWRATKFDPDSVSDHMDWPVNEADLEARHKWLCRMPEKTLFQQRVKDEHDYYDPRYAGYWAWGLAAWIGSGWCAGEWYGRGSESNQCPGINTKAGNRPQLSTGRGIYKQLPHLCSGRGIHKTRPHLGTGGHGEEYRRREVVLAWIRTLRNRLRNVRVCCGDWLRSCNSDATTIHLGMTAVFLDPPYSAEAGRANAIYRVENLSVAHDVREWCKSNGANPELRICLCGYESEGHEELESLGWDVVHWKTGGGMANQNKRHDNKNHHRERMWFSKGCLKPTGWLFD